MEVTKELLLEYRDKRQRIKELEHVLNTRWKSESMLGNDTIFDYRKGYPMPRAVIGFDRDRYERMQDNDIREKEKLEAECRAAEEFVESIKKTETKRIFRLYFIDGNKKVTQDDVAKRIGMDRSRISRKIDDYLKNAHKAQKAHL